MGVYKDYKGSRYMMQSWIIRLLCCLGWLCNIALAQLEISEAVTGSTGFPDLGITWMGNAVVSVASVFKGRLDLEMGARDVLAILGGPKLQEINGFGLTTCLQDASVVMLSAHPPNSSMKQFMRYTYNAHHVHSILLSCQPLRSAEVTLKYADQVCNCSGNTGTCKCIVFTTMENITVMLAFRMPGTLKMLSNSLCLLPSLSCLRNGCHGCNHGLLHVEGQRLIEGDSTVESPAAVCEILDIFPEFSILNERNCICIPVHPADKDDWTKLLIRSLKSKDKEARGVSVMATDALESYIAQSGGRFNFKQTIEYRTISLIVPRLTEVFINIILTAWFRVDGLSSSLVARRAIRDYVVDTKGTGFAASAFVTKAMVKSNSLNTNVCQVLTFRGNILSLRNLSFMVGCVNLICSVSWAVLVAFQGGTGKWYDTHSMPPTSILRVGWIMATICTGLGMDCWHVYWNQDVYLNRISDRGSWKKISLLWAVIILELMCLVSCGAVARTLGIKGFGRWIYSAMQGLAWIKWGIGSCLLGEYSPEHESGVFRTSFHPDSPSEQSMWIHGGILVYSSSFWINANLALVRTRTKWEHFPAS